MLRSSSESHLLPIRIPPLTCSGDVAFVAAVIHQNSEDLGTADVAMEDRRDLDRLESEAKTSGRQEFVRRTEEFVVDAVLRDAGERQPVDEGAQEALRAAEVIIRLGDRRVRL